MEHVINKINKIGEDIINDNDFLLVAFENRLVLRLIHIFEKYKIPVNKNMIRKNLEENLINSLRALNVEIVEKYITLQFIKDSARKLLKKYEVIIGEYVEKKTDTSVIKKSTMTFITQISNKNSKIIPASITTNFIEYMKSIIFVYDNATLNEEVIDRIKTDTSEVILEFNRNNYNFVIESINLIIKNIISNI